MLIEIINEPLRFRMYGLYDSVGDKSYGEVGCRLLDKMWPLVKQARLETTGIYRWVYFTGDRMFVGLDVADAQQAAIPPALEPCEFELPRYARHVHVGCYDQLFDKWQSLKAELATRGEAVIMPSLEIFGQASTSDGQLQTTVLLQLQSPAT